MLLNSLLSVSFLIDLTTTSQAWRVLEVRVNFMFNLELSHVQMFSLDSPFAFCPADSAVVCPWEAFGDMELSDLAQFGIV